MPKQHSSSKKGGRSGRKARRTELQQQKEQQQEYSDLVLEEAKRIVAASNKLERRRRKTSARKSRSGLNSASSSEEDFELLPDLASPQVNFESKRQASEPNEVPEGEEGKLGSPSNVNGNTIAERDSQESDQSAKSDSDEQEQLSLRVTRHVYPPTLPQVLERNAEATAATLLRGAESGGQEATNDKRAEEPAGLDHLRTDMPAPKPVLPQGTSTPEEYFYISPDEEGEEAEEEGNEPTSPKPPTTKFDGDHAEEAQRRYAGSNSGAFVAAAGNPSEEPEFFHRATDLEKASARLGENQERHDDRIKAIVNSGYNLEEAVKALRATKEMGMESTTRAGEYLRRNSRTPIEKITTALGLVQGKVEKMRNKEKGGEPECFGPALSDLVEEHPSCSKQAVFVKRLHDMQVLKHLSSCAKAADALRKQVFQYPEHRASEYLGKICLAVCKDCEKCVANRAKHEAKEAEAQQAISQVGMRRQREEEVPRSYKLDDRRTDHTKPKTWCRVCEIGCRYDIPDGENLNFCDSCDRGTHEHCETLREFSDIKGESFFICYICETQPHLTTDLHRVDGNAARSAPFRTRRREKQQPPPREPASRMLCGPALVRAAQGHERVEATPQYTPRPPSRWDEEGRPKPSATPQSQQQRAASLLETYGNINYGRSEHSANITTAQTTTTPNAGGGAGTGACPSGSLTGVQIVNDEHDHARTNVKLQMYVVWHAKKPTSIKQAKAASAPAEYGSGAAQWLWFKKTNIPIRDAAKNMKGSLGNLAANAISAEMQTALASSMVNEKEVHPKPGMTDAELDEWIEKDPTFTWFRALKDETLIAVLDSIYGVRTPEPFLRLKIEAIKTVRGGELYYPVNEFTEHADRWLNMLTQLKDGGWDGSHTDLREVFLASVEGCSLIHDHAKQSQLKNVHRLIADLKKWVILKDHEIASAKAAKQALMDAASLATTGEAVLAEAGTDLRKALAWFTQQLAQGGAEGVGHLVRPEGVEIGSVRDKPYWKCSICGHEYPEGSKYPIKCKKQCIYGDHKDANKSKTYPKGKSPLTWKGYGEAYPPSAQAYFAAQDERRKQKRDGAPKKA